MCKKKTPKHEIISKYLALQLAILHFIKISVAIYLQFLQLLIWGFSDQYGWGQKFWAQIRVWCRYYITMSKLINSTIISTIFFVYVSLKCHVFVSQISLVQNDYSNCDNVCPQEEKKPFTKTVKTFQAFFWNSYL